MDDAGEWVLKLYQLHGREIFALCCRSLGDKGAAEEVTQDVFVRAWTAASRFDNQKASARTWLYAIARNLIVDRLRAASVRPALAANALEANSETSTTGDTEKFGRRDGSEVEQVVEDLCNKSLLEQLVRELPTNQRSLVVEVHLKDRSLTEVARSMDIPLGTAKSRLSRAMATLRSAAEEVQR